MKEMTSNNKTFAYLTLAPLMGPQFFFFFLRDLRLQSPAMGG